METRYTPHGIYFSCLCLGIKIIADTVEYSKKFPVITEEIKREVYKIMRDCAYGKIYIWNNSCDSSTGNVYMDWERVSAEEMIDLLESYCDATQASLPLSKRCKLNRLKM
jgi:hypothetical protein